MKLTLLVLTVLASFTSLAQSAWTLDENQIYTQLNYSNISNYNEIFGSPDYITERYIKDNTIQLYAEYGLFKNTTLVARVPVKFIKTGRLSEAINVLPESISESKTAIGNIVFGVKQQLINKTWVLAVQLNIEANTGAYYAKSGIRTGYDSWTFTPTINLARGFKNYYIQAFTGLELRTNDYSSNYKIGGEFGYKIFKPIWLILYVDIVQSLKNGNIILPINNQFSALYINDQSYGGYGLKTIGEISKVFGATASFGSAFFGANVAKKVVLNFGLYHKF